MSKLIEERIHELDEKKRALDQEIEELEQEISIIDCRIVIMVDNFRAKRDLKLSISAPRSESVLEKITGVMEKIEEEKTEASKLRDSLAEELLKKLKERERVRKEREEIQKDYPTLCFRLCR